MTTVKEAAEAFYKGGQKDPEPVLDLLASLLKENRALYLLPEENRDPGDFFWIEACSENREDNAGQKSPAVSGQNGIFNLRIHDAGQGGWRRFL